MAVSPPPLPPKRLAATLFFLSFATVLFTLAVWKLLAFFIMPSLFFDLLFIGFPLGAFIGAKFFGAALGAMCSFFLPIVFGFSMFFPVAGVVFILTAFLTWHFYKGAEALPSAPSPLSTAAAGSEAKD